jgi:hypothetical protein
LRVFLGDNLEGHLGLDLEKLRLGHLLCHRVVIRIRGVRFQVALAGNVSETLCHMPLLCRLTLVGSLFSFAFLYDLLEVPYDLRLVSFLSPDQPAPL